MKEKELNFGESRDEEVEMVTTDELRRGLVAGRVNRFFVERSVHGKVVLDTEDCYISQEYKVLAMPTASGVAFFVTHELRRDMVAPLSRYFSVIAKHEMEFSFAVCDQGLYIIHHLVAGPEVEDVELAAAVDRVLACFNKYLPTLRYFEEIVNDHV